mmetsp:Transcript_17154/g.46536  ORF Transcript_17154/g.46536 Transcript_17154/m.46536 type:complete len:83 (-) Transcript_17154:12-260(-)
MWWLSVAGRKHASTAFAAKESERADKLRNAWSGGSYVLFEDEPKSPSISLIGGFENPTRLGIDNYGVVILRPRRRREALLSK